MMDIGGGYLIKIIPRNISKDRLKDFILGLDKDILINIKEDLENNTTTFDLTPYRKSSVITPLVFDMILDDEEKKLINSHNSYVKKLISKSEAKKSIKENKYQIGDILILKGKIKDGSIRNVKEFEVKKIIWSVKNQPVNVLILKQLSGINTNMSLNKNDCKKYHIKYEPGLQVYSMSLNFNKKKK